jgi:hypothetical protein
MRGLGFKTLFPLLLAALLTVFGSGAANAATLSATNADSVYLFTSFRNADQKYLRFLYSFDGYHWTNVPGTFLEANVGTNKQFRDPSLLRGPDGTFHLVWTAGWHGDQGFGYADSKDLIHWSDQKLIPVMTNEPTTVNVWAPELFYDRGQYTILWASTIPRRFPNHLEATNNNHRLYYTITRDLTNFTPAKILFDGDYSAIDGFIIKDGKRFVLLHKDNTRLVLALRVAFGKTALGPWKNISSPITQKYSEGPCALKVGDDWLLYFDAYRKNIYGAVSTRDFKTFKDITGDVSFPEGHKHGTALKVPRDILDGLLQHQSSN